MNKKTSTVSECLGLSSNSEQEYSLLILNKCCDVLSKEDFISDALINLGQWSKIERFFSEEELSDYEKELIYIGFTVGVLKQNQKNEPSSDMDSLSKLEKMVELMERMKKLKE